MREDVARLDRLDQETRLLGRQRITTMGELTAYRESVAAELDTLTIQRRELRNRLRRLARQGGSPDTDVVKAEIAHITSRLKELRKEVALCDGIAQRSGQVRADLGQLLKQKMTERKEVTQDELFRRRGGTGRANDVGGR